MGRRRKKRYYLPKTIDAEVVKNSSDLGETKKPLPVTNAAPVGNFANGLMFPQGVPPGMTISQPWTLFHNLRWYFVSNLRQLLSEAYCEIGLIQTIVNVPVDDGMRGGVKISSKQLDEQQLAKLQNVMKASKDPQTVARAAKWNRLYGGAAVMVFTDQDPAKPLNMEAIGPGEKLEFRAVDMWELFFSMIDTNPDDYDEALAGEINTEYFDYYGHRVHRSRVLLMTGVEAPAFLRPRLRGWGLSVVEALIQSINQYLKSIDLVYEVLDEFKVDIYKIKNFMSSAFAPGGLSASAVEDRIQMANLQKNFDNAIVLDAEDSYESKQLSFTGLAEAQNEIRKQVASDMRIPMTKLFGMSAAGFNSGEDDIEVYNGMVESDVRAKIEHPWLEMAKLRCQQLWGFVPDDLTIEFEPLRVLSAEQQENVKTQQFNRALQAFQAQAISLEEFQNACNMNKLLPVQVSTPAEELGLDDEEDDFEESDEEQEQEDGDKDADDGENTPAMKKGGNVISIKRAKAKKATTNRLKKPKLGGGESYASKMKRKMRARMRVSNDFSEDKIKRDDAGKFSYKDGGGSKGKSEKVNYSIKKGGKGKVIGDSALKKRGDFYHANVLVSPETSPEDIEAPKGFEIDKITKSTQTKEDTFYQIRLKKIGGDSKPEKGKLKKLLEEKHPYLSGTEAHEETGIVTREEALEKSKAMRAEGIHATIWQVGKTKTGKKSQYIIGVPEKKTMNNSLTVLPDAYSKLQKARRVINSSEYDRRSYEADGGDSWIDSRKAAFYDHPEGPVGVDQGLWTKARVASKNAYGDVKWQFTLWMYRKLGGRFSASA